MKQKLPITVTIITKNEASRIAAAIQSVSLFVSEIIVVDSGSTDQTAQIASDLGAKVYFHPFIGFGQQKNYAQGLANSEWVLNLDADERVTLELQKEFQDFFMSDALTEVRGVYLPRKTWYLDRWVMHGGWYPNFLMRFARKTNSTWSEPHLHEALQVKGKQIYFNQPLEHFSFPNQRAHILKNIEYAGHACDDLKKRSKKVSFVDLTLRPIWKFVDGYVLKAGFLDGTAGFFIAIHSAYATFLRYTYLYEQSSQNSDSR